MVRRRTSLGVLLVWSLGGGDHRFSCIDRRGRGRLSALTLGACCAAYPELDCASPRAARRSAGGCDTALRLREAGKVSAIHVPRPGLALPDPSVGGPTR